MPRLVATFAHTTDAIAAVADGAVHADLLAWIVLALGSAHHRSKWRSACRPSCMDCTDTWQCTSPEQQIIKHFKRIIKNCYMGLETPINTTYCSCHGSHQGFVFYVLIGVHLRHDDSEDINSSEEDGVLHYCDDLRVTQKKIIVFNKYIMI